MGGLAQIGESNNVARIVIVAALVGDPHFNTCDPYSRYDVGQHGHIPVIAVTEEVSQKEMAVLVIAAGIYLEVGQLLAALRAYRRRCRLLLRQHHLQLQFTELQVGPQSEQRRGPLYERRVCGETDVPGFKQPYYLVLFAFIMKFYLLCVNIESGLGIVVHVH
ncbi:MAG: hypothetical protein BWY95_01809 [Bacteroidetes bacterium ADurb.BinA104]|nr:MAG: hypothetical protein BWY95_01809 [Bacteroidetes bacterium ADurb.BinA104]